MKVMWFKIQNQQVRINIFAKPNAKKTAFWVLANKRCLFSQAASFTKNSDYLAKE
jgi:hypothetical protein